MKTNKEAQELIFKKAKEYFNKKRQQKKIIFNSLIMILIVPAIVLSFSMNLFTKDNAPIIENSVEGSVMDSGNTQTPNIESSTIPQRKIIYADEEYLSEPMRDVYIGSYFQLYRENFFNKYAGNDVEFLVSIKIGSVKEDIIEEFKNIPFKGLEPYTNITWNEMFQITRDSYYHIRNGDYTYEEILEEDERMWKFFEIFDNELRSMENELINKHLSELNIKYADELQEKYKLYDKLAYISFEDMEKFKTLPFGIMLICAPENIEDLKNIAMND